MVSAEGRSAPICDGGLNGDSSPGSSAGRDSRKSPPGNGSSGIPYLSRIPIVGGLFGTTKVRDNREEVLVLITPTVIRDPLEARRLTDEYGTRFQGLEPLRKAPAKL